MGSIGNLTVNNSARTVNLKNSGFIGNSNFTTTSGGTTNIANRGTMANVSSQVDNYDYLSGGDGSNYGQSTVNMLNNGFMNNLNTDTYHGAHTNINNGGFVNNANLQDTADQTNVFNRGTFNNMNLTSTYGGGEFNINNMFGRINNLNADVGNNSTVNILS